MKQSFKDVMFKGNKNVEKTVTENLKNKLDDMETKV